MSLFAVISKRQRPDRVTYNTKIRAVFKWLLSTVRSSLIKFKE